MVLCERYFSDTERSQEELLIHENVHGMPAGTHGRRPDRTYRWNRLFGTSSQPLGIPITQALHNPDHIVFFLREIRTPGSTAPNVVPDDTYAGMTPNQQRGAFLALAHLEWWLVRGRQLIGSLYRLATQRQRSGATTWAGSPTAWHSQILISFHNHFGTVNYSSVPGDRDREVYAGISQRFYDMRTTGTRPRQSISIAPGAVVWDLTAHTISVPPTGFFGQHIVDQIKDLGLALAIAEPTISDALAPEYPEFEDEVRQANNVGP